MPADKKKLIDKTSKLILGNWAQSRLTKEPIYFKDATGIKEEDSPSSGMYTYPRKDMPVGAVNITNYKSEPEWGDIMGTINHETIHSILGKLGSEKVADTTAYGMRGTDNSPLDPQRQLYFRVLDAFNNANRAGYSGMEIPAYFGAYNPKEVPGLSDDDRTNFINNFIRNLPPDVALNFRRAMYNNQAAQAQPPVR